jgi:(p)ppGpp synthase/HD superfamily hydrolase
MYAQTNIQLFNQLRQLGLGPSEIGNVSEAYRFAMPLFSGRFRASGKTFFAHLVGTASVVASFRRDVSLVTAGLLHAAYTHGDFGDGTHGLRDDKRALVQAMVGARSEEYIASYTALRWSFESIPQLPAKIDSLNELSRDVVALRLANELDEYLDLGMLYCGPNRHPRSTERAIVEIAECLGLYALADELSRAFEETRLNSLSGPLVEANAPEESYIIPSSSHRRLMEILETRVRVDQATSESQS